MNEQLLYELKQQLINDANHFGISLGDWILRLLTKSYLSNSISEDPILPLLGTLQAENNDRRNLQ